MKINPTTLMFEDLSPEEALELFTQLDNIVTHGRIDYENSLLKQWFAVAPFNELHNKLLGASVVLPAKLGLSLMRHYYNPMLLRKSRIWPHKKTKTLL